MFYFFIILTSDLIVIIVLFSALLVLWLLVYTFSFFVIFFRFRDSCVVCLYPPSYSPFLYYSSSLQYRRFIFLLLLPFGPSSRLQDASIPYPRPFFLFIVEIVSLFKNLYYFLLVIMLSRLCSWTCTCRGHAGEEDHARPGWTTS